MINFIIKVVLFTWHLKSNLFYTNILHEIDKQIIRFVCWLLPDFKEMII